MRLTARFGAGMLGAGEVEVTKMDTVTDEVVTTARDYAAAWSAGDATAAALYLAEDAVRVDVAGAVQHGRAEILAALVELTHHPLLMPTIVFEHGTVRVLTLSLVLWQGGMEIRTGATPPQKGHAVLLMRREGGRWLVLEAHTKLYPPPRTP